MMSYCSVQYQYLESTGTRFEPYTDSNIPPGVIMSPHPSPDELSAGDHRAAVDEHVPVISQHVVLHVTLPLLTQNTQKVGVFSSSHYIIKLLLNFD